MTTVAQTKLAAQPFLTRNPGFAFQQRALFCVPVRHVLRGFVLQNTSWVPTIRPNWFAVPMFTTPAWSGGGIGGMIDRASGDVDDPGFPGRFLAELERASIEILTHVDSIQGLLDYPWVPFLGEGLLPQNKSVLLAGLGRFTEAHETLDGFIRSERRSAANQKRQFAEYHRQGSKKWQQEELFWREREQRTGHFEQLHALLAAGEPGPIAALLHEWEALTVKARRIERYWEPSPFPFELS